MSQTVTASMILDLLRARHSDDVFVDECKDGPSQFGSYSRMDAWAMKKSWRHPLVIVYEIKVSRSDFLDDKKWPVYLPCCNEFYFACAHGIVSPDELPTEAGLLVGSRNTRRLHCKKKAAYRDVVIPEDVFRYILFSRARITREHVIEKGVYWREFLEDRRDLEHVGHAVSRKLRAMIEQRIDEAEKVNKALQKEVGNLEDVKQLCERLGIDLRRYSPEWEVERQIRALQEALPEKLIEDAQRLQKGLAAFLEKVKCPRQQN